MDHIDRDPAVIAARQQAQQRADLARQLADRLDTIRAGLTAVPDHLPDPANRPDALTQLAGTLARLAQPLTEARDLAVHLARNLPADRRPSWQQLADAMETDRNNLARRYRHHRKDPTP